MNYSVKINATNMCPMSDAVLELAASGNLSNFKPLIAEKGGSTRYPVCVDQVSPETVFGLIRSVTDTEGKAVPDAEIGHIAADGNYELKLVSCNGNVIIGELAVKEKEKEEETNGGKNSEALNEAIRQKADQKIATEVEINERIAYMRKHLFSEPRILRIVRSYEKHTKPAKKPACLYVDPTLERAIKMHEEPMVSEVSRALEMRTGVLLSGEKSVGKNVFAETLAWILGMPTRLLTCSRDMTPASLYGEKTTDNSASRQLYGDDALEYARSRILAASGDTNPGTIDDAARFELLKARSASVNIIIDSSELYDWLTDGGMFILNEMNMCDPNVLASFVNQLLDGTGYIFIPGRGEVKIREDCVLVGTQNPDYQGTAEQNEATMSRMMCEIIDQPESVVALLKSSVLAQLTKDGAESMMPEDKYFQQADAFYRQCRTSIEKGLVSNAVLNIRGLVRALVTVAEGENRCRLRRQIEINTINTCPSHERASLYTILERHVNL